MVRMRSILWSSETINKTKTVAKDEEWRAGPPTQLFARAADFSDVTMDCDVTKFYETFFCSVFGIY